MRVSGSYNDVTIETIDRAIRDWFDRTVDARVQGANGDWRKVPVIFSQGERWAARAGFRDSNGVLILPIISVRRTGIDPDPTKMALGVQTDFIQVAVEIDPKTNEIQNLEGPKPLSWQRDYPPIYDVYTIPFPDRVIADYQIVVQTQYIGQMNQVLEKIWASLDIQKSFVAPFENDGRRPPRRNQYGAADPYQVPGSLRSPYVVGFLEANRTDAGNFEEFTDQERIIKYTTECTVPCVLQTSTEGQPPALQVQRTAYKVTLQNEVLSKAYSQKELDDLFDRGIVPKSRPRGQTTSTSAAVATDNDGATIYDDIGQVVTT